MTDHQPSTEREDGLLVLLEDDPSTFLDPESVDELTADLRIGRRIFIASAARPSHATRFLARGFSVVVSKNGLADALPDVSGRVSSATRIFASAGIAERLAQGLRADQKISALARYGEKLDGDLRRRLSSTIYLDRCVLKLPAALRH